MGLDCNLASLKGPGCNSVLEASAALPVGSHVAGRKALKAHRQGGVALAA